MSRPTWPPKYVNISIPVLLEKSLPNGAFRFYCKLKALAWGEPTLSIPLKKLMQHTGLGQSQVYEYARLLRDRIGLPFHCADGAFECSFPDLPEIPETPELPIKYLTPPVIKDTEEERANSGKSGKRNLSDKPASVVTFRSAAKCWPSKAQWPAIAAAVGDEPGRLELWGRVVGGYILKGWNPRNVAGMLEFFKRGEVPGANGHQPAKAIAGPRLPDGV